MNLPTDFLPTSGRIEKIDALMRERLAESMRYLVEQCSPHIAIDPELAESGIARIGAAPLAPSCFAAYYELVKAVCADELDHAKSLFEEILSEDHAVGSSIRFIPFKAPETDKTSDRYFQPIRVHGEVETGILPVEEEDFNKAGERLNEALGLLERHAPELCAEVRSVVREIVIGGGPRDSGQPTYDGFSSFELWGGITLNAVEIHDPIDALQNLVHEAAHVLLFGYCIDGTLVENSDDERYGSPLRTDPRPIDGIYHAVFVLARMHLALEAVAGATELSEELRAKADAEARARAESFYDGLSTLKAHARYTKAGRELMAAAESYMDSSTRETAENHA